MNAPAPDMLAAFAIGLLGSSHCLAMCGGISAALSLSATPERVVALPARACVPSLGRIGMYTLLGGIAGAVGYAALFSASIAQWMPVIAALLLVLMGLHVAGVATPLRHLERAGAQVAGGLSRSLLRRLPEELRPLGLGMLWGTLPCGLVYSTIAWSVTIGDPVRSATLMLGFGLGTLPATLAVGWLGANQRAVLSRADLRLAAGALICAWGIASLLGHAIPASESTHVHGESHAVHNHAPAAYAPTPRSTETLGRPEP